MASKKRKNDSKNDQQYPSSIILHSSPALNLRKSPRIKSTVSRIVSTPSSSHQIPIHPLPFSKKKSSSGSSLPVSLLPRPVSPNTHQINSISINVFVLLHNSLGTITKNKLKFPALYSHSFNDEFTVDLVSKFHASHWYSHRG